MKKLLSLILLISLLTSSLISCADGSKSDQAADSTTERYESDEPRPDPEPKIDRDELYKKVFENHSAYFSVDTVPELKDLDRSKDPVVIGLYSFSGKKYTDFWVVEGISSSFADGWLKKYSISSCNTFDASTPTMNVSGYYHSAYLDVLFEHITFESVEAYPEGLLPLAQISCEDKAKDLYYTAYDDMKLYYKNDGVIYRSVQNVDAPYLHMMARTYWPKQEQIYIGIPIYNVTINEKGTPKKVKVKSSVEAEGILEYEIYPSGRVYGPIQEYSTGVSGNMDIVFMYYSETRNYYRSEEAFYENLGKNIVE